VNCRAMFLMLAFPAGNRKAIAGSAGMAIPNSESALPLRRE
jgi:hypothetical protein